MLKNNKGYMLAETIIAITIVAVAITTVFSIIINNYSIQDNNVTKYNNSNDLYTLREIEKFIEIESKKDNTISFDITENDCKEFTNNLNSNFKDSLNIHKLFYCNKNISESESNLDILSSKVPYQLRNEVKKIEKKDKCDNFYLAIFNNKEKGYTYATLFVNCDEEN